MAGMLQVLTYLLAFYLCMKGVEILQLALVSNREDRSWPMTIGVLSLLGCIAAAMFFVGLQDSQAMSLSQSMSRMPSPY